MPRKYKLVRMKILQNKINECRTPTACLSMKNFKGNVTRLLHKIQSSGEEEQWLGQNFILFNILGLRKSARLNTQ